VDSVRKVRILIVDDDQSVLKLMASLLDRAGMEPIMAENAASAAQVLKKSPLPDLLILDLMLPDVSGVEFLRQIRSKSVFDNLPVIILSALADPDQIREGLRAGADRYLTKPYLANNLVITVQEMLRSGRNNR
jgi:two-component system, OmpR family, phosphate regulon response regulator PhoB